MPLMSAQLPGLPHSHRPYRRSAASFNERVQPTALRAAADAERSAQMK